MSFFRNFPLVNYNFGDETSTAVFQNLSVYIDIIDQISDEVSFYEEYYVQDGERPDTLSYRLYGTVDYYWTFFLLNEHLRVQGWPLDEQDVYTAAKELYPNKIVLTDGDINDGFVPGRIVATADLGAVEANRFNEPPFKGRVVEKFLDLGQIVIKETKEIVSVTIDEAGSGYTSPPSVTVSGGGGKGALFQAILDSDTIDSIVVLDGGDDYKTAPTLKISAPDIPRGTQATATANISSYDFRDIDDNALYSGYNSGTGEYSDDLTEWQWDDVQSTETRVKQGGVIDQWKAPQYYVDSAGERADLFLDANGDIDLNNFSPNAYPNATPPQLQWQLGQGSTLRKPVTYLDTLKSENDKLKRIKIFKPNVIEQVNTEFQRLLRQDG